MANDYYTSVSLTRNTLAKAEDINTRTQAIETGFELLPDPHASAPTTKGFSEVFKVVDATSRDHPAAVGQIQDNSIKYAADSGAANAYVVDPSPAYAALTAGMEVVFKAANENSGASTINVSSLGAKTILKFGSQSLVGGEIAQDGIHKVYYDGTNFQLDSWTGTVATVLDEDDMASNSAESVATQQSIVSYITTGTVTMANKTLTTPEINGDWTGTSLLDEDAMTSNSAVRPASQQSIKAYVDAHAAVTATHGATGAVVGTTNAQTLTNKTLTSPVLNTSLSGTAFLDEDNMASNSATKAASQQSIKAYADSVGTSANSYADSAVSTHAAVTATHGATGAVVGTTNAQTLTNKTLTSPVINTSISGTAFLDEDDMASNSATKAASQQSIKKYVDTRRRVAVVKCLLDTTDLTTGDGKAHFTVPEELDGYNLVSVGAHVYTASTSGLPTFQVHHLTHGQDMLSTKISINANENDSATAATPPVINTSWDHVNTGDAIRLDCDIAGTGTKGMEIRMGFALP